MTQSIWPKSDETAELLINAKQGEAPAIERLLDKHRNALRRMVDLRLDQRLRQRVDASDVVQEVLIEANRRLQTYIANPVMPFHLWIRQIAKDRIIDAHRRHRESAKRSLDREQALVAEVDHSTMNLIAQLQDPQPTPAALATQRELAKQVEQAISSLDENDRDIILMRHYEMLSNTEVAAALQLTEAAASMRYLRALKKLRSLFESSQS